MQHVRVVSGIERIRVSLHMQQVDEPAHVVLPFEPISRVPPHHGKFREHLLMPTFVVEVARDGLVGVLCW